jgi:NAD(P)-dependent dehydrogenase (short-subunit alcohol dehydrogenase family)
MPSGAGLKRPFDRSGGSECTVPGYAYIPERPLPAGSPDRWAARVEDSAKKAEVKRRIPPGRAGTPEEIAAVFAFPASDDASHILGRKIRT